MGLENLLLDTCDVYIRNTTIGKAGQAVEIFTKAYSNVPCRSVHVGHKWDAFGGRISAQSTHLLYISPEIPPLDTSMRVRTSDGVTYVLEHGDMKWDSNGKSHSEYEMFAAESPQKGG